MKKKTLGGGLESVDLASKKKVGVFKISVFITSIFVIFLSVTYALVGQVLTGSKRQVVTAGDIRIRLDEENEITINNAMPVYDEVGMIGTPFKFQVVNEGSSKANYILKLIDITTGDESNKLSPSLVRYGLTKDGDTTIKNLSSAFSGSIDRGNISGNQTINYELRLWIDFKVKDESLIKDKTIKYKIGIEVEPLKQYAKYDSMMMARTGTSSTDYFWKYSKQITSVVFEPSISIPEGVESWDVSATANSGQVMAYVEDLGETVTVNSEVLPAYKLHIQARGGVVASNGRFLFHSFTNLRVIDGLEYLDTSNVTSMHYMFNGCRSLISLNLNNFDTSNVTAMQGMFSGCSGLTSLDVSDFNISKVTDMSGMFSYCSSLTSLDLSSFDTSNVTDMYGMFRSCKTLSNLSLSGFDTSSVMRMAYMFDVCSGLTTLDLSSFDTSKVTDMSSMFNACSKLTILDLSNFDTSNVTNMSSIFRECSSLTTLNVSHFDTSNVTDMTSMFNGCSKLTSLDLSNFDTSKVTNMFGVFGHCKSLTSLDISNFDTSQVTMMASMFSGCSSLTRLDLSSFDTSNVTNTNNMFYDVPSNSLITVKDETTKTWVLGVRSNLTNVQVKSA